MPARALTLALMAALAAGAARAQVGPVEKADGGQALKAAVFAEAAAGKGQGMARTSIDHRFDGKGATGALGFLCARPDSLDGRAAASPLGSDPHGRFLGARLSFAFR